jgi:5-methylcytosine-specific restriction protein A
MKKPKLPNPTGGRSVSEWIGKTPDTKIPDHVKLRIFRREKGRCHLTGAKIKPTDSYQFEHKIPLNEQGKNREANIFPALTEPHKKKTAQEVARRAKADAVAKKHLGIKEPPIKPLEGPGFRATKKPIFVSRHPPLEPRELFK